MRIVTNVEACVGAGQCVLTEPAVFDQDDDGTVALLIKHPEGDHLEAARTAVTLCPGRALSLVDDADPNTADSDEN